MPYRHVIVYAINIHYADEGVESDFDFIFSGSVRL